MRAIVDAASCSPSSTRSFRSLFFLGKSVLCKNADVQSPIAKTASQSSRSTSHRSSNGSHQSSFRSFRSSSRFSLRQDDGRVSASEVPGQDELVSVSQVPLEKPFESSRSNSNLLIVPRTNSQSRRQHQVAEKQVRQPSPVAPKKKPPATAAGGYALALAHRAHSTGVFDDINTDLDRFSQLLENDELYEFLKSSAIQDGKKTTILRTIGNEVGFHKYTSTFLDALVEKRCIHLIKDVIQEFEKIYNELTGTQVATITSAVKMESSQLALLARKIKSWSGATRIRAKNVVDPSLIAGYVIKYEKDGARYIDMSVKGQLDRLAPQVDHSALRRSGSLTLSPALSHCQVECRTFTNDI